ncbi:MAG: alcohol dehydrogenase catalytic domain-containing protein, partial [Parvularculaceae bacterium]|nr:alcohol dehydrogenase catalytic domain-containing protein [Parvularculaceae bacterium]
MSMMKAAVYNEYGSPADVLTKQDCPIPSPKEGEILVKTILAPMHNHDVLMVRGEYGDLLDPPAIGGTEGMGVVEALGEGVSGLSVGQRIVVAGVYNTWAEFFTAPASMATPIPDAIGDEVAAQLIAMPSSSVVALNVLDAKPGEWIVLNGGNGAVGKSVAQIAKSRGVNVASIVNRSKVIPDLERIGIGPVFAMDNPLWKDQARSVIKDGHVSAAIEMIGGAAAGDLVHLVGENGEVLSFGAMSN